jgi:hypothetical protein
VVTQAAKQYREQIAVALLAVAVTYLGCGLGLLFKGYDNAPAGFDFADKSALDGYVFTHPVLVASLALAVLLVAVWGEPSRHARTIVLAAVGIGAVALVFAVITWIAAFSADENRAFSFTGILGAGKVVGAFIGLAQIALLVLALFFAGMALQALPAPVRAAQWGPYAQPGWGPGPAGPDWQQQHGGWSGQPYPSQPTAPPWASPPAGPQGQWGQPPSWQPQQPGWGQSAEQGWQHPGQDWQHHGYEGAPTQAYEQQRPGGEAAENPASNADLYWRSAGEQNAHESSHASPQPTEQTERPEPGHLASDPAPSAAADYEGAAPGHAADPFSEPGDRDDATLADAEPTTTGSWSSEAGPSASELAAEPVGQEPREHPEGSEHSEHSEHPGSETRSDDDQQTDDSGWWRPSSRP